uniref:Trypsin inhibitor n=1 Tax=Trichosanthes kirilowii TaxID=3677 RepID=ITRY_TRIKI|nr:RecName: Full=Trypsin inhibitor [Trichosanthes kirilowii]
LLMPVKPNDDRVIGCWCISRGYLCGCMPCKLNDDSLCGRKG